RSTRAFMSGEMGPAPEYVRDTVETDTPARAATSAIVGRRPALICAPYSGPARDAIGVRSAYLAHDTLFSKRFDSCPGQRASRDPAGTGHHGSLIWHRADHAAH